MVWCGDRFLTPMAARLGGGRVRFNVGGQVFETTTTTLANAGRDSMLGALLDSSWNVAPSGSGGGGGGGVPEYFIDRNPACFAVLLDLLRTGGLHVPPHLPEKLLYREALYYGLLDHVRAARWGAFDGDRLRLAASVPGHALVAGGGGGPMGRAAAARVWGKLPNVLYITLESTLGACAWGGVKEVRIWIVGYEWVRREKGGN